MKSLYRTKAEEARSRPGVWVTLREGMANANLVTSIRKDSVAELPSGEFEARSYVRPDADGVRRYGVEVRTRLEVDPTTDRVRIAVEAGLVEAGLADLLAPEVSGRLVAAIVNRLEATG